LTLLDQMEGTRGVPFAAFLHFAPTVVIVARTSQSLVAQGSGGTRVEIRWSVGAGIEFQSTVSYTLNSRIAATVLRLDGLSGPAPLETSIRVLR
jgi:hypothetical protein